MEINLKQKKICVAFLYFAAFLLFLLFLFLQKADYKAVKKIEVSSYADQSDFAEYQVEEVVDSDFIIISGYAYWPDVDYKTIDYKIALLNQATGETISIPTQAVNRGDLLEKDSRLLFEKVGFYGRISKRAGAFGRNYYEICYLACINGSSYYLIHTGTYMGTSN